MTAVVKARWLVAAASRHQHTDVSTGRKAESVGGIVAGLSVSGGLGVALPCAFVKCSRLEVCDDFSSVSRRLSPALRCLHFVISDFRPASVTESGEAALRRLLASRAVGGYSLTSDDPALGSLTVFQSSRVARPQATPPHLVSLLNSSARSPLDAYRQRVCFVPFLRLLI